MLNLSAETVYGTRHVLGTAPFFRLAGMHVERGPDRERIAHYASGFWVVDSLHYSRLDFPAAVRLSVERADGAVSCKVGEFSHMSVIDGCAHADGRVVARCRGECTEWELAGAQGDGGRWSVMVLEPSERASQ